MRNIALLYLMYPKYFNIASHVFPDCIRIFYILWFNIELWKPAQRNNPFILGRLIIDGVITLLFLPHILLYSSVPNPMQFLKRILSFGQIFDGGLKNGFHSVQCNTYYAQKSCYYFEMLFAVISHRELFLGFEYGTLWRSE